MGRLSRALSGRFAGVDAVDASEGMVARARAALADRPNVTFRHDASQDLGPLPAAAYDLVYSSMVLQHIPPPFAERAIAALVRHVRPGGAAVFQVALDGPAARCVPFRLRETALKAVKKVRTGEWVNTVYGLDHRDVRRAVTDGGGRVVEVREYLDPSTVWGPTRPRATREVLGAPLTLRPWWPVVYWAVPTASPAPA